MSDLQHQIADLSPDRRRLLELLHRQQTPANPARILQLPRTVGINSFPLSFAQQRLWFIDQFQPGSTTYNLLSALRLTGPLDECALSQALNGVVQRHETLRTTFTPALADGQPLQRVAPTLTLALPSTDFTAIDPHEREAVIQHSISEVARRPFDLQQGPLLRAELIRLQAQEHVLILVLHHIIADGWSQGVLVRELIALYQAFAAGQESPLPPLPIQYADFAQWQRSRLTQGAAGNTFQDQLGYWTRQLADLPKLLLPTDYPRSARQTITGARQIHLLPPALMESLKALSQREGATLFQTLLTAFKLLLQRYTGQNDLVVGSAIANRNRAEIEPLIGCFVNTLVLRTDLSGNPTFREALRQTREITLAAYAHQDLPFEKLVEKLQPERDLSTAPLFQVLFVFQNTPRPEINLPPLTIELMATEHVTAAQDLSLSIVETPQGLRLRLQYNAELFAAATTTRMLRHFQQLLESIVAQPEQRIGGLDLLSETERHQILHTWNTTAVAYPAHLCLHQLVEAQVLRTPNAIAVVHGPQQLSYADLDAHANQLAHELRLRGVGPDVCVSVCLEPSLELIIALLGILKAGGCYLPLDPAYPQERLAFLIRDSRSQVILSQQRLHDRFPDDSQSPIYLDRDWLQIARHSAAKPETTVSSANLAYLIYTSGSTGTPKGVLLTHRGAVNNLWWRQQTWPLSQADRMLQSFSISFDPSVWNIFWPLIAGAQVVLVAPGEHADSGALVRLMTSHKITAFGASPTLHAALLEEPGIAACTALRYVVSGGEVLSSSLQQRFFERLDAILCNCYGPTEATIEATSWVCSPENAVEAAPIGRPLPNVQVYILDAQLQPVPVGVAGELHVGGIGLARGYHRRPDLTAERFIPNPFAGQTLAEPGARLYRTGDLARYRADGAIEFLGRIDYQVKLRGARLEPGEIEALLRQHESVREAVVVVREEKVATDGDPNKRLVAYIVGQGKDLPVIADLRRFLQERLPSYMIPSAFVLLDALPTTPSGKLDRNRLPVTDLSEVEREEQLVLPRTPLEEMIAGVWAAILAIQPIGIHDNFFALGGHSLLATQVVTRLRQLFERDIPLRLLFDAPTIAEFASQLAEEQSTHALPVQPVPRDGRPLPLSFAQQRLWFLDQVQPDRTLYSIPLILRLSGPLDHTALERSLNVIVERHEVLRTTFAYNPDALLEPYQRIAPPGHVPLPLVVLPAAANEETIRQAVERVVEQPFDFQNGPLLRATVFRLSPTEHILAFVIHHSIFDGWSQSVLVRELTSLYEAFVQQTAVTLPPLPCHYADYAVWQRQWLTGWPQAGQPSEVLHKQLGYWQQQLLNTTPLELPLDYPRPAISSDQGDVVSVQIPVDLSNNLRCMSQELGCTLFMTLLAVWQMLLYRYSGQPDIAVGTPIAGRVRPELEELIGCFVNTLVLRTDLSGAPSFTKLLARVRRVCLDAYAHQDLPFELLVEHVQPERDLSRTPLFQVMFVLQNMPRAAVKMADLSVEPLPLGSHTAKFDLLLALSETPDGLSGAIEYRADLFTSATIVQMAACYQRLLAAVVADPNQRIDRLALLAQAEQHRLLAPQQPIAIEPVCVHDLIAAQALRTPDARAVQHKDQTLTYRQLDQRANQLAHYLRSLGVRPDMRVGVYLERSPDLVVALLGILKAGGAYVPLDPGYPQERLAFMVEDAAISVLVTSQALEFSLSCYRGPVIDLDRDALLLAQQPVGVPCTGVDPDHLMYIIYTSGSTGTPKGVLITHRALVSYLYGVRRHYTLLPSDRVLLFASISFDASVEELFTTLTTGATVVLRTDEMLDSPRTFMEHCRQCQITVLSLPTAFWHVLAEAGATSTLALPLSLRMVIIGGEQAALEHVRRWQEQADRRVVLVNAYGPTETTIAATAYVFPPMLPAGLLDIPIGLPLANARIYVLDAQMQLVPLGVPGELYIGGQSVARGYLNRPDLTAEKFIPDPFCASPQGARLYKTGDRVRYGPEGTLIFLGRVDTQVKIRGFRIELGEVEAALRQYPNVQAAVVVLREDYPGDRQLVAYVVSRRAHGMQGQSSGNSEEPESARLSPADLQAFLQQRLPAYMVPAAFVLLDALPMTPSDKIDHRALPAPIAAQSDSSAAVVMPQDRWELWLAQLWADLLHRPVVGVTENFFTLGGHSLLAVQMMAHIQQHVGRSLPIAALLQAPTIQQFAAYLRQETTTERWTAIVPLRSQGDRRPLFLIHPIGGTVFCYMHLVQHLAPERPVYGLQAPGIDAGQTPHTSIPAMATEYVAAIQAMQPRGPYLLAGWSMGGTVAFEVAHQLRQQGEQVQLLALIDTSPPSTERRTPNEVMLAAAFAQDLAGLYGQGMQIAREELEQLPADDCLSYVLMQARRQAVLPPGISQAQLDRLAATFRAHLSALHAYAPSTLLERAVLLEARAGEATRPNLIDAWRSWIHHLEPVQISGDHYGLMRPPQVGAVAEWLEHQIKIAEEQARI